MTTLTGNVVTDVRYTVTAQGHRVARFRMVVQPRRFDRATEKWVDGADASFYSVVAWRTTADNVAVSVHKGDPIFVTGKLRIREWEKDGRSGISVEIDANAIGHDLSRGQSTFRRPPRSNEGSLEPVALGAA